METHYLARKLVQVDLKNDRVQLIYSISPLYVFRRRLAAAWFLCTSVFIFELLALIALSSSI